MGSKPKTPKPSSHEKALAKDAATRWNDYVERYVPVENEFVKRTKATADKVAAARGIANADAGMAMGEARQQQELGLAAQGAAPGSGRAVMAGADLTEAYAEASGAGQAGMQQAVHDQEQNAKVKMAAFGRDLQDQSALGLGNAARTSQQEVLGKYERKIDQRNFNTNTAAGFAGLGIKGAGAIKSGWNLSGEQGVKAFSQQDRMLHKQTRGLRG
jgi:hypothetical protein